MFVGKIQYAAITAGILAAALSLAGCSGSSDSDEDFAAPPTAEETGTDPSEYDQELEDDESSLGSVGGGHLQVGECWGLEDDVTSMSAIPCDGPHIYEVFASLDDFDYEQCNDIIAETEAREEYCEDAFSAYFDFPYEGQDTPIINSDAQPVYGDKNVLVCSAHSGPGAGSKQDVTGSFEDRGIR